MNDWQKQLDRARYMHDWYCKQQVTDTTPAYEVQSIAYWRGFYHGQVNALMAVRQCIAPSPCRECGGTVNVRGTCTCLLMEA